MMGMSAEIGIGIVGGGYMGKAHAVAFSAVKAVFDTALTPRLEMVAATSAASAERYRAAYGFARATDDWRVLVDDPRVGAVIIATPSPTHRAIVERAAALRKPILCEKPLGGGFADAKSMTETVEQAGIPAQVGYNYIRTPATQFARELIAEGALGQITWGRFEHAEDFFADPDHWAWRAEGEANGTLGDLACHPINMMLALRGPVAELQATLTTVHHTRAGKPVTNDDIVQMMVRFPDGGEGHLLASRIATGRKMGYAYELHGTEGSLRFDQEDQNALHLYRRDTPEARQGFTRILTGPAHPDYLPFCQGPAHGTGYQDQIIIEAKDFLDAIEAGQSRFPTFRDGLEVARICAAARRSHETRSWVRPEDIE